MKRRKNKNNHQTLKKKIRKKKIKIKWKKKCPLKKKVSTIIALISKEQSTPNNHVK